MIHSLTEERTEATHMIAAEFWRHILKWRVELTMTSSRRERS